MELYCILFRLLYIEGISNLIEYVEKNIQRLSIGEIIYGAVGALIALVITSILAKPLLDFNKILGPLIVVSLNVIAAVIGMDIMIKKKDDITNILLSIKKGSAIKTRKVKQFQGHT